MEGILLYDNINMNLYKHSARIYIEFKEVNGGILWTQ